MWYKLKKIYIYPDGVTEKQVRPYKKKEYDIDITHLKSNNTYSIGNRWVAFSKDWVYFYSQTNREILQYTLSTPFDLSTASQTPQTLSVPNTSELHQLYISLDWTKLAYWNYSSNWVGVYDLTTPYDITTATNRILRGDSYVTWLRFNPDGTKMYVNHYSSTGVQEFSLSTPRDPTTWTLLSNISWYWRCVSLSPEWDKLIYANSGWTTYQYTLTTPRDISNRTDQKTASNSVIWYYPTLSLDGSHIMASNRVCEFYEKQ